MENNKTINNKTMKKIILTLFACSLFTSTFFAQTNENYGLQSLLYPQLGNYNAAFGKKALMQNSGIGNSAVGYQAMIFKTTGDYNTAVGGFTLTSPNTRSKNTAIGYKSQQEAIGFSNTSLGFHTLRLASGNENIAVGNYAMKYTTTGSKNTLIGVGASEYSTTASNNTGVGYHSLFNLTTGEANVALGKNAGQAITSGSRNILIGPYTLGSAANSYNIIMGYRSAATTGDNNIIIGKKVTLPAGTSNAMNIGGVLFGTGFQSALPQSATAAVSNGQIGINAINPLATLDVTNANGTKTLLGKNSSSAISFIPNNANSHFHISHTLNNSLQISQGTTVGTYPMFTILNTGKVGIGTTTPSALLEVKASGTIGTPVANNFDINKSYFKVTDGSLVMGLDPNQIHCNSSMELSTDGDYMNFRIKNSHVFRITQGMVGVNTDTPTAPLDVAATSGNGIRIGKIGDTGNLVVPQGGLAAQYNLDFTGYRDNAQDQVGARISALRFNKHIANSALIQSTGLAFYTNPTALYAGSAELVERMRITPEGNVGIGTTTTGTHKLAVEGSIGAREIRVEAPGAWSDFVFEDGYKLPSLTEVEQHIKEKGHLQDIPSTQEVTQSGINLGEMDAKLLQKIEELMLYTIAQNKEVEALKQIVKLQDEKLQKLEAIK